MSTKKTKKAVGARADKVAKPSAEHETDTSFGSSSVILTPTSKKVPTNTTVATPTSKKVPTNTTVATPDSKKVPTATTTLATGATLGSRADEGEPEGDESAVLGDTAPLTPDSKKVRSAAA